MKSTTPAVPRWISDAREAVEGASDAVRSRAELEAVSRVADELQAQLEQLRPLAEAAALGRGTWWRGYDVPGELAAALAKAAQRQDQRELDRATRLLSGLLRGAQVQILEQWRAHVQSRIAGAGELQGLVQYLAGADDLDFDADRLNQLLGSVARSQGRVPTADVVHALDEAMALLAQLERVLPEAARRLLGAAARGGAPLTALTPELLRWLEQHGVALQLRIVPGRPVRDPDA